MRTKHLIPALAGFALWQPAPPLAAQGPPTSDLWAVAAGTLAVPAATATDGSAALWTPAVAQALPAPRWRIGVEAIHSPAEVGVVGTLAFVAVRASARTTAHLVYGRVGLGDLARTETSPETVGGEIPVFAQVVSVGAARELPVGLVVGTAVRYESGRLDVLSGAAWAVDFGAVYSGIDGTRIGIATQFLEPLGGARRPAEYAAGVESRAWEGPLWGTEGTFFLRYGVRWPGGEDAQHLVGGGLSLGRLLRVDLGASREESSGSLAWRSRLGIGVAKGPYRVLLGRDGGVNGFGAAYRFGLEASFP